MENEKRLIDAIALIDKLKKHHDFFVNAWGGFSNMPVKDKARVDEITNCIAEVVNAPTVDAVEVVHGRWRWCGSDRWNDAYQCSSCGKIAMNDSNYCPNCGAKMDGGE